MSYRPRYKENGVMKDLPLDSETLNGYTYKQYATYYKTASATANAFTVSIPYVTALEDGMIIHCQFNAATATGATLNVNNLGAKGLYYRYATAITTHIAKDNYVDLIYSSTIDKWVMLFSYDSNTNTIAYQVRTNSAIFANKTGYSMNRYMLYCEVDGGLSGFATTIATGTTKTTVSPKYIPGGVIKYYSTSGAIANNANFGATGLWDRYTLDLRYSFNIGTSVISAGKPVYIRMSKNTDGTLSPHYAYTSPGKHPIATALPTTADGDVYVYLGKAYSTSSIELDLCHPMYEFVGGKIQVYTGVTIPTKTSDLTNDSNYATINDLPPTVTETTVSGWGFTKNAGTVTSVGAGTGLSISGTGSVNPTVNIASGYKLPTTTEWGNKQDALSTQTAYTTKGSATKVPQITTNSLGQVTSITEVDISAGGTGTVTSVTAGTGLSISGTSTVNPKVNIASGYKLPTTTQWNSVITTSSLALGENDDNSPNESVVLGLNSRAYSCLTEDDSDEYGWANVVIGYGATAVNDYDNIMQSIAIGKSSAVTKTNAIAIGHEAHVTAQQGIAIGVIANARYSSSIAIGYNTNGPDTAYYTRIGCGSYTSAGRALLLGNGVTAFTYMNSAGSSWSSASDIRDKTDIKEIDSALDFINSLKPITYVMNNREDYLYKDEEGKPLLNNQGKQFYDEESHRRGDKKHNRRFAGLSAQDTYQKMIEFYKDNNYADIVDINKYDNPNDEYLEQYSMQYERLVPFLIKAIQEQQEQIDELKKEIEELKK